MQRKSKGLGRHDGNQQCRGGFEKLIRPICCSMKLLTTFLASSLAFSLHCLRTDRERDTREPRNVGQNISTLDGNFVVGFRDHRSTVGSIAGVVKDPPERTISDAQTTLAILDDRAQRQRHGVLSPDGEDRAKTLILRIALARASGC
jgi:hypothetical protein